MAVNSIQFVIAGEVVLEDYLNNLAKSRSMKLERRLRNLFRIRVAW